MKMPFQSLHRPSLEMLFLAKSALPMFLMMVVMVFIMIAFPELATYLPSTVRSAGAG